MFSIVLQILGMWLKFRGKKDASVEAYIKMVENAIEEGKISVRMRDTHIKQIGKLRQGLYEKSPEDLAKEEKDKDK